MNTRLLTALAAALVLSPIAAHAQAGSTAPAGGTRREMSSERREAMQSRRDAARAMTPEQRETARASREARFNAMPADQQQFLGDQRAYQQGLREKSRELRQQVTAGSLTRNAMAEQLKAYRDVNRPSRPASLPDRKRNP